MDQNMPYMWSMIPKLLIPNPLRLSQHICTSPSSVKIDDAKRSIQSTRRKIPEPWFQGQALTQCHISYLGIWWDKARTKSDNGLPILASVIDGHGCLPAAQVLLAVAFSNGSLHVGVQAAAGGHGSTHLLLMTPWVPEDWHVRLQRTHILETWRRLVTNQAQKSPRGNVCVCQQCQAFPHGNY